ncbi:GGDEF domain-containing protein [Lachnospira multipara]|uniref:GGDEF domain-containing protein n=1 Tax=Lachnospira multipara TaxID=28051 RepID=UPI0004E0C2A4|nr:GGDEF domain-containing protein [Lachnospira multipara]
MMLENKSFKEGYDKNNVEAEFVLDELNYIINGDERFYRLIGEFSLFSFDKIVFKEDREEFLNFVNKENKKETIILRVQNKNKEYRYMRLIKMGDRLIGDETLQYFRIQDMENACLKFRKNYDKIKKYRSLLGLIPNKLFDYDIETKEFTIFFYNNHKAQPIVKKKFDDWKEEVITNDMVDEKSMKNFDMLCECIENQMENFSITITASILTQGARMERLSIKGASLIDSVDKKLVLGVITQEKYNGNYVPNQADNGEIGRDSATGLYNKKTITDKITEHLNFLKLNKIKQNGRTYLLVLDIDNFKQVNDTYGHYFGDEVINRFAKGLSHMAADNGMVGRIGGDEFMVLLDNIKDEEELRIKLKSMRLNLKLELKEVKHDYLFSSSIGVSRFGVDGTEFETLFKIADACLYIAKDKGKDRFIIYDVEKHGDLLSKESVRVAIGNDFLKPIDKYELVTNLILRANNAAGFDEFSEILKELGDKLNLHGIRVFAGEGLRRVFSTGYYNKDLEDASYINNPEYSGHFDEHEMYIVNNIVSVEMTHPELAYKFTDDNICSFIQIRVRNKANKCVAMMEFDIFGEIRRKWSSVDICTLRMLVIGLSSATKSQFTDLDI